MIMNLRKANKGITLIALVITIIILLILSGISISTITGKNGILNKANNAKIETEKANAKEKVQLAIIGSFGTNGKFDSNTLSKNLEEIEGINKDKTNLPIENLPATVVVDDYLISIDKNGQVILDGNINDLTMPSTTDTTPFLPESATIIRNNLQTGIVIKDENDNEWVWIEVPKSIYGNTTYNGGIAPTNSEDYTKIENVMKNYAKDYRLNSWKDTFFNTDHSGFTNETEYNDHKNTMLKNVFENGGFYVGRYEAGTKTERGSTLVTPIIQRDAYPYHYVTCKEAQTLSNQLIVGEKQASLMFGIQWDLIMKFVEEKGAKTKEELATDSTSFANYKDASFTIKRGLYYNTYTSWIEIIDSYTKPASTEVLLSTGASNRNCTVEIYDLAGNLNEYTLERSWSYGSPCSLRGGNYRSNNFSSAISTASRS